MKPHILAVMLPLVLASCVTYSPIPEPEPDPYLHLEKLLVFIEGEINKQKAHGHQLRVYMERLERFVEAHRKVIQKDAVSGDAQNRHLAIAGLGFGGPWALETLDELIKLEDPLLRPVVVLSFAFLQQRRVVPENRLPVATLRRSLDSEDWSEILNALFFFSTSVIYASDTELMQRVAALLKHSNPRVRMQAARTLSIHKRKEFVNDLIRVLQDSEPAVRGVAAGGVVAILDQAALPYLLPLLNDPDPPVRDLVTGLVVRLAPRGIEYRCPICGTRQEKDGACGKCGKPVVPVPRE
jgi:hypothetical protein